MELDGQAERLSVVTATRVVQRTVPGVLVAVVVLAVFVGPAGGLGAASCVESYRAETLGRRGWAFDGTLAKVTTTEDSRMGRVRAGRFEVHRWYTGGSGARVTVELPDAEQDLTFTRGSRYLVAGEPRWGGRALDDPIAWACGFTQPSTSAGRDLWKKTFRAPRPPGEPAVWRLRDAADVSTASRSLTVEVTRLGCNGGMTGVVHDGRVEANDARVVVTFDVAATSPGAHTCPGNPWVPMEIELGEALGRRQLVDGACMPEGPAVGTGFCASGPVRWTPPR